MALFKNEVGEPGSSKLYVWSERKGEGSKEKVVISAHGGIARINGMEAAPDCNLVFYSPHGHILNDPSLSAVIAGSIESCETLASSQSPDYDLSKYTNSGAEHKHNKTGENYAMVGKLDEQFAQSHKNHSKHVEMLADLIVDDSRAQNIKHLEQQIKLAEMYDGLSMDIVTIRNRFWHKDPKLSEVLKILWDNGYEYKEVHCNFCRGSAESYIPKKVNLAG